MMLLADWDVVSDGLCMELLLYDAANHPHPKIFDDWAAGKITCPYDSYRIQRSAHFRESRLLWRNRPKQKRAKSAYQLMCMVLQEKCKGWEP